MRKLAIAAMTAVLATTTLAQLRVAAVEKLPLPTGREWHNPRFSPDGARIYVTQSNYAGIWEFTKATGELREITQDLGAGYGFALSPDGARVAYRRFGYDDKTKLRIDQLVLRDLRGDHASVIATGRHLSLPLFVQSDLVYSRAGALQRPFALPPGTGVLGIEDTKIVLVRNGERIVLDPFEDGRYIWPALSPDGTRLVAVEMSRGAFVCDVNGVVLSELGRRHAPAWTRSGRWIVYMDDRDDGHRFTSSDLMAITPDGSQTVRLTDTVEEFEMFPACSPTADEIVFSTMTGGIYLLRYSEEAR